MAASDWFDSELIEADSCAERVSYFRFRKPDGYSFLPGQYMMLRVPTAEGPQTKPFTISDAPADDFLEITTRVSQSAFKQALAALAPGGAVEVSTARGKTVLPEDRRRVVFLTGGVGITPARAILRDAAGRGGEGLVATLLYGNLDERCVPFIEEFREVSRQGWCDLVLVLDRPPEGWTGETGFITADTVRRYVDIEDAYPYVVSGPPAMVTAMERVLDELAVPAERRIVESFSGY